MTDLLSLLDTTIQEIGNSKTTENHCGVPVVPNYQNRFGNNNPLINKAVPAVPVIPSENNIPSPESGNSVTPTISENAPRAISLMFSLGRTGTTGTGAETLEKTVPKQVFRIGNNGNSDRLFQRQINGLTESDFSEIRPYCCICATPIDTPVDTLWGADPAHRPCAEAAFQANKGAGRYKP